MSNAKTFRFLRSWLLGGESVTLTDDPSGSVTLVTPERTSSPRPGWILLYGMTRQGRRHPRLVRFARALAASGAAVAIPEVEGWQELRLDPRPTRPAVEAGIDALRAHAGVDPERIGAIGFSFGAPQLLRAVGWGDPEEPLPLRAVAGFGGYGDLFSTLRFQFFGEFEEGGTTRSAEVDPYGRWIVTSNFLTKMPGLERHDDVASALRELAAAAGDRMIPAASADLEPVRDALAGTVAPERRSLFRLLAQPGPLDPDRDGLEAFVRTLYEAGIETHPALRGVVEPGEGPEVRSKKEGAPTIHLFHGRDDRLIPYTETLKLAERLAPGAVVRTTITGLFSHSEESALRANLATAREGLRFARGIRALIAEL